MVKMNEKFKMICPNCSQFYCLKSLSLEPKSNIPLLLKCGHATCESCIRNIVKFGEPIACKICHREMEIKTTDIAELLKNETHLYKLFPVNVNMLGELTLEKLLAKPHDDNNDDFFQELQAIITETEQPLGQCLECQADTSLMCQQCATIICADCFDKSHKNFTVFKNHVLKNIEFQIIPKYCDTHKEKSLEYYCKDCAKSVCMDCLLVGSEKSCKSHDVVPTVQMNETLLNDIREISPQVDAVYRRLTKTAVDIGHIIHNMNDDSGSELKQVTATIEQHFSALQAKIQNHKEEIMNIIARLKNIEKDSLVKAKNDVAKAIVDSKQVMKSLKSALESDQNKSVNLSVILNDAKNILARPWCLTKNESSKDTLKVTVNDDLCLLISDFIQLEGNAKALYKLRATHELDEKEIPPPPNAPVLPPLLPKDVRFENTKEKPAISNKIASPKQSSSESSISRPKSKKAPVERSMSNEDDKCIQPGTQISARITHMVDPHHFYVQRVDDEMKLTNLQKELQENLLNLGEATLGLMYAVNLNGTWMRCRIDVIDFTNCHITCVDYGTTVVVTAYELRNLPDTLTVGKSGSLYPVPLAIECSLANCIPAKNVWTSADTALMQNIIENEPVTLHVRSAGGIVVCDVLTRDGTSVAHALAFHGRAVLEKPFLPYPEVSTIKRPKLHLSNNFNSTTCEHVHLTHVINPDNFYVRAAYLLDDFIKLCADLNQEYDLSDKTGSIYLPENGMVCVVHINKKDWDYVGWARAIVKSREAGTVTVFLPDIGNTIEVHWHQLRRIKEKFTALRGLATKCHLAGVRPSNGDWQENSSLLLEIHKTAPLKLIVDRKHNRRTVGAILFSQYGDETVCINQEMVINMIAEATGSIDFESILGNSNVTPSSSNKSIASKSPKSPAIPETNSDNSIGTPSSNKSGATKSPKPPGTPEEASNQSSNAAIRLEAKVMHYESPSLIYFALVHQQKTFDELFDDIQKFYGRRRTQKPCKWKVNDRCCAFCKKSQTWRRASILNIQSDRATLFYTDFACTETVPLSHLKTLHSDFEVYGDAVLKCHLAGILPASGDQWPSFSKEFLKEEVEKYSRLFITKVGDFIEKSMPVELWVYHTVKGSALEPDKSEWRCLNREIVKQGLGIPDPSYQIEEAKRTAGNDMSISFLNLTGPVDKWLLKAPWRVRSPGSGAGSQDESVFVSDWLPAEPLTSKEFTAVPTYIDNDGIIYLHDVKQEDRLEFIRDTLEMAFKEDDPKSQFCTWRVGEPCIARYYLDGSLYRGTILEVNEESTCLVQYVDYGNNELCAFTDLRKGIALHQLPIQAHKCVLSRINPVNGNWETNVLDYIHKTIVEKKCLVKVTGDPIDGITPINLNYDKLSINDHLVEFDMATYIDGTVPPARLFTPVQKKKVATKEVVKPEVYEVDCESELDYIIDEEESAMANPTESSKVDTTDSGISGTNEAKSGTTPVLFYPEQKKEFKCTVTTNDTNLLELSVNVDEETNALYKVLFENVQSKGEGMPPLEGIFENQACLALYREDDKWYRALVLEHSAARKLVKVRYVDYGNIGIVPLNHTRAISEEWVVLPPMLMSIKLTDTITAEVADLLKGPMYAKILEENGSTFIELRNNEGELVFKTGL